MAADEDSARAIAATVAGFPAAQMMGSQSVREQMWSLAVENCRRRGLLNALQFDEVSVERRQTA